MLRASVRGPLASAINRSRLFRVTEEYGWWVKGILLDNLFQTPPNFEISAEDFNRVPRNMLIHPQVPLTYLGIWEGRRTLAEFQLGSWPRRPTDEFANSTLLPLLSLLRNVGPMYVAPLPATGTHRRSRLP